MFNVLSGIVIFVLYIFNFLAYLIMKYQDREIKSRENLLRIVKIRMDRQDKMIDLMAKDLTTDYHSKEWVIQHYVERIDVEK